MRKWWLLLAFLALWHIVGYALIHWRPSVAKAAPSGAPAPTRIVSLAPNLTEILYALQLDDSLVGVTLDSDYPPAAADKPQVGSFWQLNIEAIVALRPDLVVALDFQQHKDVVRRLDRMGYACLTTGIWTVDDFYGAVVTIGAATDRQQAAEKLIDDIRTKIRALQEETVSRSRPRVLWVVQREPLRVAGRDTFVNELIELAGGQNAIGPTLHKYPPIGTEQVLACDVEVIIEPTMAAGDADQQREQALAYWSRWPRIPAVEAGSIHVIDGDIVSRLSPRLYQGIETIAQCLQTSGPGE